MACACTPPEPLRLTLLYIGLLDGRAGGPYMILFSLEGWKTRYVHFGSRMSPMVFAFLLLPDGVILDDILEQCIEEYVYWGIGKVPW